MLEENFCGAKLDVLLGVNGEMLQNHLRDSFTVYSGGFNNIFTDQETEPVRKIFVERTRRVPSLSDASRLQNTSESALVQNEFLIGFGWNEGSVWLYASNEVRLARIQLLK